MNTDIFGLPNKADDRERAWLWRGLALTLILLATAVRIGYLAAACPLDLAPDEAHYWDWSRHLDWCFYSKGPAVALLIRLSCWLLGDEMLAVRLPAVLCGGLLLVSLYLLTVQVFRRERLAAAVVAIGLTFPLLNAGAVLMTIDAPYACCWGWALVLGYTAIFGGRWWAWPMLGAVVGAGILAKYTMVLWFPCLGLFLLTCPDKRRLLVRPGFWTMTAIAALCCLPILLWNRAHGWVGYQHTLGHAGVGDRGGLHWLGPLVFIGGQFALLLGYWFTAWIEAILGQSPWRVRRPAIGYLWWLSVPVFGMFLLCSLKNGGGELNWPATAYLSGLVLSAGLLVEPSTRRAQGKKRAQSDFRLVRVPCQKSWHRGESKLARAVLAPMLKQDEPGVDINPDHEPGKAGLTHGRWLAVGAVCLLGLAVTALVHRSDWARPVLLRIAGPATVERPTPLRRWDPTCRLRGWRHLAAAVDEIREQLRLQGIEPVLAAGRWNLPGELAFYCRGQPTVYCLGSSMGDRHSQYDFWRPNPLADAATFAGKTFILVDCPEEASRLMFDEIEPPLGVVHREGGEPIAQWTITTAYRYRPTAAPVQASASY